MIELFSTFFDRLSSHNLQCEQMLKSLDQFKALLYANDGDIEKYFIDLNGQKSPLKRDSSQTKKSASIKTTNNKQQLVISNEKYQDVDMRLILWIQIENIQFVVDNQQIQ
ncbi:unnamed protein product [Paramecium pentaurelia]|uniref:Uncharacterized protein n=1 Tax=Paramecium pentaurelia TaxID=43138 RepID=A0A8S1Y2N4_9CILI|nr:unnamed protein product [Paramecium pentaurelia]